MIDITNLMPDGHDVEILDKSARKEGYFLLIDIYSENKGFESYECFILKLPHN
jgi:hypothetical protein